MLQTKKEIRLKSNELIVEIESLKSDFGNMLLEK